MIPNCAQTQQEIVGNVMLSDITFNNFRKMHSKVFIIDSVYKVVATRIYAPKIVFPNGNSLFLAT